ncbi:GatB/YqeY domain-containing protein [Oceanicella actignis]|uniref:GatB/YqeY domain-containing protein n=1 Tax=Oceanicella actignis TaxID=1189325 RepID=UPI0011E62541|nr:GatB/YqeY domain-containing protein [Oceanicella actignis]TYO88227.1 hypothetical protein LY05_02377 [Oceanicella actignis]
MRDRIAKALTEAMKAKDQARVSTLRLIMAAIKDRDIAARAAEDGESRVPDAEIAQILAKMIKQREDSIRAYEEAGRLELAERERAEIDIIREFLPRPLTEEEAARAVSDAIARTKASSIRDMGAVMKDLKSRYAGRMDFAKAGAAVREALR